MTIQSSVQYKVGKDSEGKDKYMTVYYLGPNGDAILPRVSYTTPNYSYVVPTTTVGETNITLNWSTSDVATSYLIYKQTATGNKYVTSVDSSVTSLTLKKTAGEHIYGVAVCIKNRAGTSYAPIKWAEAVVVE